jgi:hypothetical protein
VTFGPITCRANSDCSLAQMELSKLVAAFFLRFDGIIDSSMSDEDMRMYDTFNAGPAGAKLLLHLREL